MCQRFDFGKNWQSFNREYLNEYRIEEAKKSLQVFLGLEDLRAKTFLDIGCGSGLFSLAAYKLGAGEVVSFDVDDFSVRCCRELHEQEGSPQNWRILLGSVLDENFLSSLAKYNIVYSWGVLHHTGRMWQAISNAASLVKDGGYLHIAIYNKADGFCVYPDGRMGPSKFWHFEKRIYHQLPKAVQNLIDYFLMSIMFLLYILTFRNPIKKIKGHKQLRGMSWRIDVKDWLGGYPYEYASVSEVFKFVRNQGFILINLNNNNGLLNNEYLFQKEGRSVT
jgi:2-polyprenyl-6-hydroxyphenyl methylase/3-demethylubiquinone-9 3-methyltransferase